MNRYPKLILIIVSAISQLSAQNKGVLSPTSTNIENTKNLSVCTQKNVSGKLPVSVNIPQNWCADEKKPADVRERVKPENGLANKPNHTVNNSDLVYGGMDSEISFNKLPAEVRQLIKLTFPEIASDKNQLFSLMIVAENFPSKGRFSKFVKNYKYTLQSVENKEKSVVSTRLPTWSFVRQNGKLKLRYLEILTWDENEKTYK